MVVLVRYSIYRSIAILVNVRYRYLVVSRYFDISNIEWINDQSDDTWAIYKYRVSNEISSIVWYDSWSLKPGLYFECKSTPYTVIRRPFCALGAFSRSPMPIYADAEYKHFYNTRTYAPRSTQEYKRHYARICVDSFAQFGLRTTAYGV